MAERLDSGLSPDPSLGAADAVRIQMTALQRNTWNDGGIRTTYRFTSPANKRVTGPYARFAQMIKSPPYRAMLNARHITYGEIRVFESEAVQEVSVTGPDGENITYVFILRRQSDSPFQGCWMTEAVFVKPDDEQRDYRLGPPGVS